MRIAFLILNGFKEQTSASLEIFFFSISPSPHPNNPKLFNCYLLSVANGLEGNSA